MLPLADESTALCSSRSTPLDFLGRDHTHIQLLLEVQNPGAVDWLGRVQDTLGLGRCLCVVARTKDCGFYRATRCAQWSAIRVHTQSPQRGAHRDGRFVVCSCPRTRPPLPNSLFFGAAFFFGVTFFAAAPAVFFIADFFAPALAVPAVEEAFFALVTSFSEVAASSAPVAMSDLGEEVWRGRPRARGEAAGMILDEDDEATRGPRVELTASRLTPRVRPVMLRSMAGCPW